MVGVEVPAGEFEGVKRSVRREMKKKKRKKWEERCDALGLKKKKKINNGQIFGTPLAPPTTSLPHHSFSIHLILSWPAHPFLALFSIFFFSLKHSSLHSYPFPPVPPCHHLHHLFRQDHRKLSRNL